MNEMLRRFKCAMAPRDIAVRFEHRLSVGSIDIKRSISSENSEQKSSTSGLKKCSR